MTGRWKTQNPAQGVGVQLWLEINASQAVGLAVCDALEKPV
jgi:hypothetical protein